MDTSSKAHEEGSHLGAGMEVFDDAAASRSQFATMAANQISPKVKRGSRMVVTAEAALQLKKSIGSKEDRPFCMVDPRKSTCIFWWDVLAVNTLLFVAIVTPYEVGFLDAAVTPEDTLFLINRGIDAIFLTDMVLQFCTVTEVPVDGGESMWATDRATIALHYMKTWFLIDFVSVSVSALDYISMFASQDVDGISNFRMLRMLRALRLIKLIKLFTASKILKRYEVKVAINYAALSLSKCVFGMLLLSHWMACIWGLQTIFSPGGKENTWMVTFDYCTLLQRGNSTHQEVLSCVEPWQLYVAAVYWAVMSITSIGYGDIAATSTNSSEQVVCTILMILGAMGWGLVLGALRPSACSSASTRACVRTRGRDLGLSSWALWGCRYDRLQSVQSRP